MRQNRGKNVGNINSLTSSDDTDGQLCIPSAFDVVVIVHPTSVPGTDEPMPHQKGSLVRSLSTVVAVARDSSDCKLYCGKQNRFIASFLPQSYLGFCKRELSPSLTELKDGRGDRCIPEGPCDLCGDHVNLDCKKTSMMLLLKLAQKCIMFPS